MTSPEQTVLIVDDAPDYRIMIRTVLRQNFPDANILKADGTKDAVSQLGSLSDKEAVRLIIDGLEGEWREMVNRALSLGISKDNMVIFSATPDIENEATEMGIQFTLKPASSELESTIIGLGDTLRLKKLRL